MPNTVKISQTLLLCASPTGRVGKNTHSHPSQWLSCTQQWQHKWQH